MKYRRNEYEILNQMLDDAIAGTFEENCFDESELSKLQTKLMRYLTSASMSEKKICEEKNNIKELITNISHQTKTPLTNILMYAELLTEAAETEKEKEYAGEIYAQGKKLESLIGALVKMSRLETGIFQYEQKPCRIIRKISPVEAVKFSDCPVEKLSKHKKAKGVTPFSMAWENLKRNKKRTTAVLLSMVLSVLMINVTVSIVSCFDEDKYISMFAGSDFSIADATLYNLSAIDKNLEGVSAQDMEAHRAMDGVTESGAIYMEESEQKLEGDAWERMKKIYEEHTDWYVQSPDEKEWWDSCVYDRKEISSHLYGVDELIFHALELETDKVDWNTFCSGDYAIVSSMLDSDGNDADLALYQVGEKIPVQLPDGSTKEYEVIGIGDVPYVMGPMHSHGMDIYITIPAAEYLKVVPQAKGALQFMINVEKEYLEADEAYVEQYCNVTNQKLDFKSRKMYLQEFKDMVNMFLIVGGALSAILALIGILNFINLTYTSIHERKQELKILWSVGMTKKQIASMLSFEGMLRMGLAFVLVLTVGQLLNYYVVYAIAGGMIMFTSHYVIWPMLVCIPVFGVIAALIPRSMVKKIF